MTDMLLDVSVFYDHGRGDPRAQAIIQRILSGDTTASVSPITLFELWRSPDLDRRTEIRYVSMVTFLEEAPLTAEAAKMAGVWIADVEDDERERLSRYALIAATARERGEPIATNDTEPFSRFHPELVEY